MSTWEHRGFELRTRLRLGGDLLEWNIGLRLGLEDSLIALATIIKKQRPDLNRQIIYAAVRRWHEAMYDQNEGTAAFGRRVLE